jgi:hypothetical protein
MRPTPCGEWAKSVAALKAARVARTNSVGHPVRRGRGGPLASYFIVQSTLSRGRLQLVELEGRKRQFVNISLEKLAEQLEAVASVLDGGSSRSEDTRRQAVANVGCGGGI